MAEGAPRAAGSTDWTVQAADTIERVVVGIRDKTAVPLTTIARALVYGLLAAVIGAAAMVLLVTGLIRVLDTVLPRSVWLPDLILGTLFTLVGFVLWRKRKPPQSA
ncbi:MAG: hypothetical protein ACLGHT_11605 [Acidimicrobiia bacterium]